VLALCASCPSLFCLGATLGDRGVRYARSIIITSFKTRPRAKEGCDVRYARKIVNGHHVSYACMLPPCARLVRIMSPTVLSRRYARRPRRTLRSHDCQRASRKLSVHEHPCARLLTVRIMSPTILARFLAQPRPPGASSASPVPIVLAGLAIKTYGRCVLFGSASSFASTTALARSIEGARGMSPYFSAL
jgi:hypothetical protein